MSGGVACRRRDPAEAEERGHPERRARRLQGLDKAAQDDAPREAVEGHRPAAGAAAADDLLRDIAGRTGGGMEVSAAWAGKAEARAAARATTPGATRAPGQAATRSATRAQSASSARWAGDGERRRVAPLGPKPLAADRRAVNDPLVGGEGLGRLARGVEAHPLPGPALSSRATRSPGPAPYGRARRAPRRCGPRRA
jgi:hypothetical protein